MKTIFTFLLFGCLSLSLHAADARFKPQTVGAKVGSWTTDLTAADALYAREKNVPMLIWFSGLDWNAPDKIFLEQIALSQVWQDYAKDRLILINVDNSKKLFLENQDEPTTDKNLTLARMYGIKTLPTFALVMGEQEKLVAQELRYDFDDTPLDFIDKLEALQRKIESALPASSRRTPPQMAAPQPAAPEKSASSGPAPRQRVRSAQGLTTDVRNWHRPYDSNFNQEDWKSLVEFRESFSEMMRSLNRTLSPEEKRNQASRKFATFRIEMGVNILTFIDLPVSYSAITTILGDELLKSFPEDQRSRYVLSELLIFSEGRALKLADASDLSKPGVAEEIISSTLISTLKYWSTDERLKSTFGPLRFNDLDAIIESILKAIE
ncbi:hypothetical protein P0Y35_17655 [Kiritimatiellaeota bacterium B1221]|nr:hypothetical protein [Kiritimatiellaeota bacterium B1221]